MHSVLLSADPEHTSCHGNTAPSGASDTQSMESTSTRGPRGSCVALEFHLLKHCKMKTDILCLFFFSDFKISHGSSKSYTFESVLEETVWRNGHFQILHSHSLAVSGPLSEPHSPHQPHENGPPPRTPPPPQDFSLQGSGVVMWADTP